MSIKKFEEFTNSEYDKKAKYTVENLSSHDDDEDEESDDENEEDDDIGEDYAKFDDLLQGKTKESKKIANNTYAVRLEDGSIAIRLYETNIVTFYPTGDFKLSNGGFETATTFSRINEYIPQGYKVMRTKGQWFLHTPNKTLAFENNMVVKRS